MKRLVAGLLVMVMMLGNPGLADAAEEPVWRGLDTLLNGLYLELLDGKNEAISYEPTYWVRYDSGVFECVFIRTYAVICAFSQSQMDAAMEIAVGEFPKAREDIMAFCEALLCDSNYVKKNREDGVEQAAWDRLMDAYGRLEKQGDRVDVEIYDGLTVDLEWIESSEHNFVAVRGTMPLILSGGDATQAPRRGLDTFLVGYDTAMRVFDNSDSEKIQTPKVTVFSDLAAWIDIDQGWDMFVRMFPERDERRASLAMSAEEFPGEWDQILAVCIGLQEDTSNRYTEQAITRMLGEWDKILDAYEQLMQQGGNIEIEVADEVVLHLGWSIGSDVVHIRAYVANG